MWTQFWDMSSGGSQKLEFNKIYIEAPENEATEIFIKLFNRDPNHVTCSCCGPDYSISEYDTLEEATEYDLDSGETLEQYKLRSDIKIIPESLEVPDWFIDLMNDITNYADGEYGDCTLPDLRDSRVEKSDWNTEHSYQYYYKQLKAKFNGYS